jgi:DNA-binding NarL/FixJ family response regulator
MENSTIRILVVDDFERWRRFAARTLLEKPELQVVSEASDGLEAVQKSQQLQPDLVLLDIGLPTLNGIQVARQILQFAVKTKILFLSEQRDPDIVQEAMRIGGGGYVVKVDAATELLPAVEAVLQGRHFFSASLAGPSFANHENGSIEPPRRKNVQRHDVKFYPDNAGLVDGFAQFTKSALRIGNAVLIIATESLRNGILQRLGGTVWIFILLPNGSGIFPWTFSTRSLRPGSEKLWQRRRGRASTLQLVENVNLPCGHKVKPTRFNGNDSCAS